MTIQLDALLKDRYVANRFMNQINEATIALDNIEKTSKYVDFSGRQAKFPIQLSHPQGFGFAGATDDFPTAVDPTLTQGVVDMAWLKFAIKVEMELMERSKNDAGAFARGVGLQMDSIAPAMRRHVNFLILNSNGAGNICYLTADATSTSHVVSDVTNLEVGMRVAAITRGANADFSASSTVVADTTITAIVPSTKTVTFADSINAGDPAAAATTTWIFRYGEKGKVILGIPAALDGTIDTYLGVSRASYGSFNGVVNTTGTKPTTVAITEAPLYIGDTVINKTGINKKMYLASHELINGLAQTFGTLRQYNDAQAVNLKGGYRGLTFSDTSFFADEQMPGSMVYMLTPETWQIHQTGDLKWVEPTPGNILQKPAGKSYWVGEGYWPFQVVCVRPNANVINDNLKAS